MKTGYMQPINPAKLKKLVDALTELLAGIQPGNPELLARIESESLQSLALLRTSADSGCAVVGAADALLSFIKESLMGKMRIRKPYPKER